MLRGRILIAYCTVKQTMHACRCNIIQRKKYHFRWTGSIIMLSGSFIQMGLTCKCSILCFVVVKLQLSSTKRSCPRKVTGSVLQPGLLFVAVFVCKIVPPAACSVEKQSPIAWYIMSSSSIASDRRGRTDKTSRVRTVNPGTNRCN